VRGGGIGKAEQGIVRMDCAGRGNRKGRIGNGENGLCGEGESERQNREWEWQPILYCLNK
jgi:hypothetical protein